MSSTPLSMPPEATTAPQVTSKGVFARLLSYIRFLAHRFLLLTLVLIGAFCGVLAVIFHKYVELARHYMIGRSLEQHGVARVLLVIATPTIVFSILAWTIRRFAPRAVGANLARVRMAYNEDPSLLGPRAVGATFIATPLSLGAGCQPAWAAEYVEPRSGDNASMKKCRRSAARTLFNKHLTQRSRVGLLRSRRSAAPERLVGTSSDAESQRHAA